jgi:hypothetical protein
MALIGYRVMRQRLKLARGGLNPEKALSQLQRIQRHRVSIIDATPIIGISAINTQQAGVLAALNPDWGFDRTWSCACSQKRNEHGVDRMSGNVSRKMTRDLGPRHGGIVCRQHSAGAAGRSASATGATAASTACVAAIPFAAQFTGTACPCGLILSSVRIASLPPSEST